MMVQHSNSFGGRMAGLQTSVSHARLSMHHVYRQQMHQMLEQIP